MIIYKNLNIRKEHKNAVIAIGNFDGLHLGHQKVLKEAKLKAKKNKLKFGLVTFEPVPVMYFNPEIKNHRINNYEQKLYYLKKLNLDFIVIIKFNKSFSRIFAKDFIKDIIFNKLNANYIFVSKNFRFGKKRKGNIRILKEYEDHYFFKTIITSPYKKNKKIISSSLIRKKIKQGKIIETRDLLGRNWSIEGKVVKGNQRGRKIGFPTCNIRLNDYVLPKLGVYAVLIENNLFKKKGIANIGFRPTFNGKKLFLEVNIFGINLNLYNKMLKISFIKFIRREKKFKGVIQLKQQIKKDITLAK